jgi:hypothetical protein
LQQTRFLAAFSIGISMSVPCSRNTCRPKKQKNI